MSYRVVVLPEAEEEIGAAATWYGERRPGLGIEFLGCIDDALARIAENPMVCAVWPDDERYRRLVVPRFPFLVFFELRGDSVEVVAVAHASREPGYWRAR